MHFGQDMTKIMSVTSEDRLQKDFGFCFAFLPYHCDAGQMSSC